jgi:predicted NAD/FAD-binding protein
VKLAIIGSGIAGLTAAWLLSRRHDITVFEAESRLGGHTATVDVPLDGQNWAIDTGFIVYNDWTYPNFIRLMQQLEVETQATEMSFSVSCPQSGLEYSGSNLNTLFAQRKNLLSPGFLLMIRDILRFNRQAVNDVVSGHLPGDMTLGQYLDHASFNSTFRRNYLIPMTAAIWSAGTDAVLAMPLTFFVRFFSNHGLLNIKNRPQWRTLIGGSRQYIEPLSQAFREQIRLDCPVLGVQRRDDKVIVRTSQYGIEDFDQVVIATHSDQALAMLEDATSGETTNLSAIPYQRNDVVLHTDTRLLPETRTTWSAWNYRLDADEQSRATVTYNMNILQRLNAPVTFCTTLNNTSAIDPKRILGRYQYHHPVFSVAGIAAQQKIQQNNGDNRTWFCGAWCRNGFHEDGVVSAVAVARNLGVEF